MGRFEDIYLFQILHQLVLLFHQPHVLVHLIFPFPKYHFFAFLDHVHEQSGISKLGDTKFLFIFILLSMVLPQGKADIGFVLPSVVCFSHRIYQFRRNLYYALDIVIIVKSNILRKCRKQVRV